ncbi:serine hydrolase domain-containing protein [Streptomyces glaucosporus]|uniref:Serine hydrolase domain-containing protein n=1 Tax=Streptomyces glaucosporus TaxID=284044 RepID=A0ABN3IYU9_9ACTN
MSVPRRGITRRTAAALAAAPLLSLALPGTGTAATPRTSRLRQDVDALRDAGVVGVSARLDTPHGTWSVRSGVGDLDTGRPVPLDGYVRIGSTTKTFVATVLLQLVGEGRVSLADTVERWLPGVVRGSGNDGRRITLRHLLRHTSGIPDYIADVAPDLSAEGYRRNRWTTCTSEERVALAMKHPPSFEPGAGWEYSNTNYVLAGMVIRSVTGRSWEEEVRSRILRPLRLVRTLTPGDRPFLPRPHARNHQQFEPGGPMVDTTVAYLPFDGDADGSMIGTTADLNRFFTALMRGELLAPAQLAEMRRTTGIPQEAGSPPGRRCGLGLYRTPLSCGGGYWEHGGSGFGSIVQSAVTGDGQAAVTVSVHSRPADEATAVRQLQGVRTLVDHALCDARDAAPR